MSRYAILGRLSEKKVYYGYVALWDQVMRRLHHYQSNHSVMSTLNPTSSFAYVNRTRVSLVSAIIDTVRVCVPMGEKTKASNGWSLFIEEVMIPLAYTYACDHQHAQYQHTLATTVAYARALSQLQSLTNMPAEALDIIRALTHMHPLHLWLEL